MPTEITHLVRKFTLFGEIGSHLAPCWVLLAVLGNSTISLERCKSILGSPKAQGLPSRMAHLQLPRFTLCSSTNDALPQGSGWALKAHLCFHAQDLPQEAPTACISRPSGFNSLKLSCLVQEVKNQSNRCWHGL